MSMGQARRTTVVALMLLAGTDAGADVCRSTRHPGLVMDSRVVRNAEGMLDDVLRRYRLSLNNSYRSYAEQQSLYERWLARGKQGNPTARPGRSRHESGFAFDVNGVVPLPFNDFNNLLNTGERWGFGYILGDWEGRVRLDWPHFEADPRAFGLTLDAAIAANRQTRRSIPACPPMSSSRVIDTGQIRIARVKLLERSLATGIDVLHAEGTVTNVGVRAIRGIELAVSIGDPSDRLTHRRIAQVLLGAGLAPGAARAFDVPLGQSFLFFEDAPQDVAVSSVLY